MMASTEFSGKLKAEEDRLIQLVAELGLVDRTRRLEVNLPTLRNHLEEAIALLARARSLMAER